MIHQVLVNFVILPNKHRTAVPGASYLTTFWRNSAVHRPGESQEVTHNDQAF